MISRHFTVLALLAVPIAGQTFQRLGGCPTLGCIFPPDQCADYEYPDSGIILLTSTT